MFNILNWLARRQRKQCSEEMENRLTGPLTTNACHLRLVEPATVTREDFGDKFDKVVEVMEGGHDSQD